MGLSYNCHTVAVVTVRMSEEEKACLARRAKAAGITSGALVRQLVNEKPIATAADLLAEMEALMGEKRLTIRTRK
jgi:hypothetical protein